MAAESFLGRIFGKSNAQRMSMDALQKGTNTSDSEVKSGIAALATQESTEVGKVAPEKVAAVKFDQIQRELKAELEFRNDMVKKLESFIKKAKEQGKDKYASELEARKQRYENGTHTVSDNIAMKTRSVFEATGAATVVEMIKKPFAAAQSSLESVRGWISRKFAGVREGVAKKIEQAKSAFSREQVISEEDTEKKRTQDFVEEVLKPFVARRRKLENEVKSLPFDKTSMPVVQRLQEAVQSVVEAENNYKDALALPRYEEESKQLRDTAQMLLESALDAAQAAVTAETVKHNPEAAGGGASEAEERVMNAERVGLITRLREMFARRGSFDLAEFYKTYQELIDSLGASAAGMVLRALLGTTGLPVSVAVTTFVAGAKAGLDQRRLAQGGDEAFQEELRKMQARLNMVDLDTATSQEATQTETPEVQQSRLRKAAGLLFGAMRMGANIFMIPERAAAMVAQGPHRTAYEVTSIVQQMDTEGTESYAQTVEKWTASLSQELSKVTAETTSVPKQLLEDLKKLTRLSEKLDLLAVRGDQVPQELAEKWFGIKTTKFDSSLVNPEVLAAVRAVVKKFFGELSEKYSSQMETLKKNSSDAQSVVSELQKEIGLTSDEAQQKARKEKMAMKDRRAILIALLLARIAKAGLSYQAAHLVAGRMETGVTSASELPPTSNIPPEGVEVAQAEAAMTDATLNLAQAREWARQAGVTVDELLERAGNVGNARGFVQGVGNRIEQAGQTFDRLYQQIERDTFRESISSAARGATAAVNSEFNVDAITDTALSSRGVWGNVLEAAARAGFQGEPPNSGVNFLKDLSLALSPGGEVYSSFGDDNQTRAVLEIFRVMNQNSGNIPDNIARILTREEQDLLLDIYKIGSSGNGPEMFVSVNLDPQDVVDANFLAIARKFGIQIDVNPKVAIPGAGGTVVPEVIPRTNTLPSATTGTSKLPSAATGTVGSTTIPEINRVNEAVEPTATLPAAPVTGSEQMTPKDLLEMEIPDSAEAGRPIFFGQGGITDNFRATVEPLTLQTADYFVEAYAKGAGMDWASLNDGAKSFLKEAYKAALAAAKENGQITMSWLSGEDMKAINELYKIYEDYKGELIVPSMQVIPEGTTQLIDAFKKQSPIDFGNLGVEGYISYDYQALLKLLKYTLSKN